MKKRLLLLVMLLVASLVAFGQKSPRLASPVALLFIKGQDLHDVCKYYGEDKFPAGSSVQERLRISNDSGFCSGYIVGQAETLSSEYWSPTTGVTVLQIVTVVKKYLDNHPEKWNDAAMNLVMGALSKAFPPKKTR
jgi:hypothetical protein